MVLLKNFPQPQKCDGSFGSCCDSIRRELIAFPALQKPAGGFDIILSPGRDACIVGKAFHRSIITVSCPGFSEVREPYEFFRAGSAIAL
jgi:hypothetical protein